MIAASRTEVTLPNTSSPTWKGARSDGGRCFGGRLLRGGRDGPAPGGRGSAFGGSEPSAPGSAVAPSGRFFFRRRLRLRFGLPSASVAAAPPPADPGPAPGSSLAESPALSGAV